MNSIIPPRQLEEYGFYLTQRDIPPGWTVASLQDVSHVVTDGTHKTPTYVPRGVRFISIKNIKPFQPINWDSYEKYITREEHQELTRRCKPERDDILFPRIGTLGYAKRIDFDEEVSIFVGLGLVKPIKSCVLPSFMEYYLNTPYIARLSADKANGSGRMTLPLEESRRFPFPVPPLAEQHRIVAKIEELFSELDKGVESLTTAREQLKAYRQSVLKHAFEGKLTRPSGEGNSWPDRHLGEFIEFLTSGSRGWADYYADEGDLFIRAQNLKHDRLELSDIAFVSLPPGKTEGVRTRVRLGDVLITITGANVTKTGLVNQELGTAYVSQHVALCRPTENLDPEFLYWYLLSEAGGRRQLNEAAYGAGKPGLNLENIRGVSIPVPSLSEQRAVVSFIVTALECEKRINDDASTALKRVEALRQSILKRAFCGELVAQDVSDEPASALLERIRNQHGDLGAKQGRTSRNGKREAA